MDITYCSGKNCPIKERCRRFGLVNTSGKPGVFIFNHDTGMCKDFWGAPQKLSFQGSTSMVVRSADGHMKIDVHISHEELKRIIKDNIAMLSYEERLDSIPLKAVRHYVEVYMGSDS